MPAGSLETTSWNAVQEEKAMKENESKTRKMLVRAYADPSASFSFYL